MPGFLFSRQRRSSSRRAPLAALASTLALAPACVVLVIAGCAPSASSTAKKAPTATPAPRVLYQSDLVNHANEWSLPPQWRIVQRALVDHGDTLDAIDLTVPYNITAKQYTVTVVMRILAAKGTHKNDNYVIIGEAFDGHRLYTASMSDVEKTLHSYTQFYPAKPDPDHFGNNFGAADYTPGVNPHPYVIQVDGVFASFAANGAQIGGLIQSVEQFSPAHIVIQDQAMDMAIQSVTITTP